MSTIKVTFSPDSPFVRSFLASAGVLIAFVWRIHDRGDRVLSVKVGYACLFIALACLGVWGTQRITGRLWTWLVVFIAVLGYTILLVWATVFIGRAVTRFL